MSDIPYITPEEIDQIYVAFSASPDATAQITARRMVRWAEAIVRVGIGRKDRRISALENVAVMSQPAIVRWDDYAPTHRDPATGRTWKK